MATRNGSSNRGFAGMDAQQQREISSKGGHASHGGRSHSSGSRSGSRER